MKLEMKVKKDVIENPDLGDIKVKRKFLIFPKIYEFDDKRIWCWLRNVYEQYSYEVDEGEHKLGDWGNWYWYYTENWQFERLVSKKVDLKYNGEF